MNSVSRRKFLQGAAVAAGAFTLPRFSIGSSHKSTSKVNIAFIGVGGIARVAFDGCNGENYVVLCDVDSERSAPNRQKYAPDAPLFADFREMLDKMGNEIDAVVVSIPDHNHFAAAMAAMQLGKHVYVQKPLAHNIWQCRTLQKAAHHYDVISQMGNQGHATEGIRLVREWYEAGSVGQVSEVHAWFDGPNFAGPYFRMPDSFPPPTMAVPDHLNWDAWLGTIPWMPYSSNYHPLTWRGWWKTGCGELGDWACHTLDAPFWSLDLGMPTKVEAVELKGGNKHYAPQASHLIYHFPRRGKKKAVKLHWYDGGLKPEIVRDWDASKPLPRNGMIMVGEEGSIMTGGRPDSPKLIPDEKWADFKMNRPGKTIPRVKGGPFQEWVRAIKGEGPMPGSNFDYSARLTEMAAVGVLAQRTQTSVDYDAKNMTCTNHPEFDVFLKEPVRRGWSYGEEVWT